MGKKIKKKKKKKIQFHIKCIWGKILGSFFPPREKEPETILNYYNIENPANIKFCRRPPLPALLLFQTDDDQNLSSNLNFADGPRSDN